jgi:hypothetical protein
MILKYLKNNLIAFDQGLNTLAGGDPDETLSSRFGKKSKSNTIRKVINALFFWQKDHCAQSIEADEGANKIMD